MSDIKNMQVGQVVDFVQSYNQRQKTAEKVQIREEKHGKRRKATQHDINSFFG